jgi:hypothetical protein
MGAKPRTSQAERVPPNLARWHLCKELGVERVPKFLAK